MGVGLYYGQRAVAMSIRLEEASIPVSKRAHINSDNGRPWRDLFIWLRRVLAKLQGLKVFYLVLAGIAVCTWFAFNAGLNLAASGFLFLVLVVLAAVYGGFGQATVTSIVAVACLNYFFMPPLFRFTVSDPQNWVALGAFEFTALVVSRLSHHAQTKAAEAVAERRDTERLYQTARRLLLSDRSSDPGTLIPRLICEAFAIGGVLLFDAVSTAAYVAGVVPPYAEERARGAYYSNNDKFEPALECWFCALRLGARPVGGLALCGCNLSSLTATALASLTAIALERRRSFDREFRAEAAREAEQLRTAVLDALAHEFKTPLTTILTASSGLLASGSLSASQADLVGLIDEEAGELNSLASRLLKTARLDSIDFKPNREPLLVSTLIDPAIESLKEKSAPGRFRLRVAQPEVPVMVDRKLIITALAQIIENAVKYSVPDSLINIEVNPADAEVVVSIENGGQGIAPADRERIFERFFRAPATGEQPPGTGLGLSIVKRIVEAHHGRVWAQSDQGRGSTFSLALPAR